MFVNGRKGLVRIGLPSAARKRCFHCEKQLSENKPLFVWNGAEPLVMHALCFADWLRRAQVDFNRFFGVEP